MSDYSGPDLPEAPDDGEPHLDQSLQREAELAMSDDDKHGRMSRLDPDADLDEESESDGAEPVDDE